MCWLLAVFIYLLFMAYFVWAWKRFHDVMNSREEDYLTGNDDTDWGDKS